MRNAASGSARDRIGPRAPSRSQRSQSARYQRASSRPCGSAASRGKTGDGLARKFCTRRRSMNSSGATVPAARGGRQCPSRCPPDPMKSTGCTSSEKGRASRTAAARPGSQRSSWWSRQTYSPCAARSATLVPATQFPTLASCTMRSARRSWYRRTNSRVPSVDPSSATTTSMPASPCSTMLSSAAATNRAPLKVGISTDSHGAINPSGGSADTPPAPRPDRVCSPRSW